MVCGDRSGDAAYGKIMKFMTKNVMLKHIPYSLHPYQFTYFKSGLQWFGVVCGGLGWFAVVCGNSTVPSQGVKTIRLSLAVQNNAKQCNYHNDACLIQVVIVKGRDNSLVLDQECIKERLRFDFVCQQ